MTITVQIDDTRHAAILPRADVDFVVIPIGCPDCGATTVHGLGIEYESHDTYRARAVCHGCGAPRGVIRTQVETLFGIEEDERVLHGPWRVY